MKHFGWIMSRLWRWRKKGHTLRKEDRELFKKGDTVRFYRGISHWDIYHKKPFKVLEDELSEKYSGVWVDELGEVMGEDIVMYRRGDQIRKAEVLYNFDIPNSRVELKDLEDNQTTLINKEDLVGFLMKDYILEEVK